MTNNIPTAHYTVTLGTKQCGMYDQAVIEARNHFKALQDAYTQGAFHPEPGDTVLVQRGIDFCTDAKGYEYNENGWKRVRFPHM